VVVTSENSQKVSKIIRFAQDLGVADIRLIPAAQDGQYMEVGDWKCNSPILKYRTERARAGLPVRGIPENGTCKCRLVLDDLATDGTSHYPCIIYLRERGKPIGVMEDMTKVRSDRAKWSMQTDTSKDPICSKNCLDVCVAYNDACLKL